MISAQYRNPKNPTRMRSTCALLIVGLVATLLACKKGSGKDCTYNKDCKDTLVCLIPPAGGSNKCMELEQATAACGASAGCKQAGECGIDNFREAYAMGKCSATSEEHCKKSSECASEGKCTFNPTLKYCMK